MMELDKKSRDDQIIIHPLQNILLDPNNMTTHPLSYFTQNYKYESAGGAGGQARIHPLENMIYNNVFVEMFQSVSTDPLTDSVAKTHEPC